MVPRRAIRRPKVERILELVRQKRELEDQAEACVAKMESLFMATLGKTQIAVDARLETVAA